MPRQRRIVHFSGRVQGVGFRATTRHLAGGFDVTGYVQNLRDGRVRAEVQGESGEIDAFLDEIADRLGRYIQATDVFVAADLADFDDFEIRGT